MQKLYLATSVLSRAFLLKQLGIPFEEIDCNIIEKDVDMDNEYSPYEWVKAISSSKARAIIDKIDKIDGEAIIVGADTIVTLVGQILHRPRTRDEGIEMLKRLQGRKHTVYTGLTVIYKHQDGTMKEETYVDGADVYMHNLNDKIIEAYVDTTEPYDKAGGYAIHGKGALLIENIYGDFYTVAGLPLRLLNKSLFKNGIDIVDLWK